MLYPWGENVAVDEPHEEIVADPRECPFELPPFEQPPIADSAAKALAIRRIITQAERERAAAAEESDDERRAAQPPTAEGSRG